MAATHSAKYQLFKDFYQMGVWDDAKLKAAVEKGYLTAAEYKEIVGKAYKAA